MRTCLILLMMELGGVAWAHSWTAEVKPVFNEELRAHILDEWQKQHAPKQSATPRFVANGTSPKLGQAPPQAAAFSVFAPKVEVKWDEHFLYVESNGMPAHPMMVGITAWQQQVPLPQAYYGDNAWRIPLKPVRAKTPANIENHFLRGAIAIAVNGIPIFNPQNNRGEMSYEIGELDRWGGHCGRADDYHYHTAPLHLQAIVGKGMPVAYALDGYPMYGLTEPDGAPVETLDECHGHDDAKLGYHYHAAMKRPYVQSAFHGEVVEAGGQVDPQPRARAVREALPPLHGAEITGFENTDADHHKLTYTVNGEKRFITYSVNADGTYPFEFDNGRAGKSKEVYTARRGGGGPPRGAMARERATFVLASPEVADGGNLPMDYTGDGTGATLPLEWKGAPPETRSYALIMDHLAPGNEMKSYWIMWDIPASVTSLPKNVKGIGKLGASFKGAIGYEPPHSKGPGAKTYVLHVYALSAAPQITVAASSVNREVLLAAIQDKILARADLSVVYTRGGKAVR